MKIFLALCSTFIAFATLPSVFAQELEYIPLEIQCASPNQELDIVIKRSPETKQTYALLLSTERLETYTFLQKEMITTEDISAFHYQNADELVLIDLTTGQGKLHMSWPQFENFPIDLKECRSTVDLNEESASEEEL